MKQVSHLSTTYYSNWYSSRQFVSPLVLLTNLRQSKKALVHTSALMGSNASALVVENSLLDLYYLFHFG